MIQALEAKTLVLVIDDDLADRKIIRRLLGKDFHVIEAASGHQAREVLKSETPGCILLDYSLPDVQGWALLTELAKEFPVVLLTGHEQIKVAVESMRHGARDFLCKGDLRPADLLQTLTRVIEIEILHRALEEQQQELEVMVKNTEAIVVIGTEGLILFVNPAAERLFCDQARRGTRFKYPVEDGTIELPDDAQGARFAEMRVADIVWRSRPARLASVRDISAQTRAEEGRCLLERAIEHVAEMVVITDRSGTIKYVNPAFERITGFSRSEVLGQDHLRTKNGHRGEALPKEILKTIDKNQSWTGRITSTKKDGSALSERMSISSVLDQRGQLASYIAVKRDISVLVKLEKQLLQAQKMESLGQLAGGVAHDFNNMLSVILGHCELCLREVPSRDPLHEELQGIRVAVKRSAEMVSGLLGFARHQPAAPEHLVLNDALDGMISMIQRLIGENIEVVFKPGQGLRSVRLDPSQLNQILVNLCVNARDVLPDGGQVTIETSTVSISEDACARNQEFAGNFVVLTVSDNGTGMDVETQERIFDPFFTTKEVGKGTGLGLAITYGIVRQNGGFITVDSELGRGTTFKTYLPGLAGESSIVVPGSGAVRTGTGETVLIVEDEGAILSLCARMLKKLGYRVLTASTPAEALKQAENTARKIDLLLTDVVMPEMNGYELSRRLRSRWSSLKVVFTSGYTSAIIARHGVKSKGTQFLQKPFSMEDLARAVQQGLSQASVVA